MDSFFFFLIVAWLTIVEQCPDYARALRFPRFFPMGTLQACLHRNIIFFFFLFFSIFFYWQLFLFITLVSILFYSQHFLFISFFNIRFIFTVDSLYNKSIRLIESAISIITINVYIASNISRISISNTITPLFCCSSHSPQTKQNILQFY